MSREDEVEKLIEEELAQFKRSLTEYEKQNREASSYDEELSDDASEVNEEATSAVNATDGEQKNTDEVRSMEKQGEQEEQYSDDADDIQIEWVDVTDEVVRKKLFKKAVIYNAFRYVVMLIALIAFGYAAYELTLIYVESKEGEDIKVSTSEMFLVDPEDLIADYEPPTGEDGETIAFENQSDGKVFVFDYEKMLEYNSDAKGYIRQENGEYIDNPILQHPETNDYYLTHLADHKKSSIGSIFIDSNIKDGLNAKNCIIYGHNIGQRAGKIMFGSLNWYYSKTGYYKEHPTFDIWIENTRYRYYVFAIYKTEAVGSWVYRYAFDSDEHFMEYIAKCKAVSKYKFKEAPEITPESQIITLSTCTHTDEMRMIVQLVRGEELDIYGNPVVVEEGAEAEGTDGAETTE